jgi:DNA replication and repair protein RecF
LTVLHGRNAQGKTSLLESIYLLATGRSFRSRRLEEAIAWDGGPIRVSGEVDARIGLVSLAAFVDKGVRELLVDGTSRDLDAYLGRLDLVDLTAPRMDVLKGVPEERRRFIDRGVVGLQSGFLSALGELRRSLSQRNALLRSSGGQLNQRLEAQLEAWDDRLVRAAVRVHSERRAYTVQLAVRLGGIGRKILTDNSELRLHYKPSPKQTEEEDPDLFAEIFQKTLLAQRKRDAALGFTGSGPHRDELKVDLDGVDLRKFGSAGQQRAAMICLKLAKLAMLEEQHGEAPVFLMDDFDTDIDEEKAGRLIAFLEEHKIQALVATSKQSLVDRLDIRFAKVRVADGGAVQV